MKNKFIMMILSICMLFAVLPVKAYATNIEAEETVVADPEVGSGTAVVSFKEPEGWPGYNIVVEVYNQTVGDFYTIYSYRQNGYVAKETLPAGSYTVDVVMAAGDNLGEYPLSSSVGSFELESGKATNIDIYYSGDGLVEGTEEVIEATPSEAAPTLPDDSNTGNVVEDERVGNTLKNSVLDILKGNLLFVLPFGILGGIYYFKIYKPKKDLTNDN